MSRRLDYRSTPQLWVVLLLLALFALALTLAFWRLGSNDDGLARGAPTSQTASAPA